MEDEDIFEDAMEDVGGGEVQGYPLHEVLNPSTRVMHTYPEPGCK